MSIVHTKKTEGIGEGVLEKTIYEGSTSIMFDVLQSSQYSMPYKSSVRELVSNSLDSVREKQNALGILKGDLKIKDLYLSKDGEEFQDSSFDRNYYNKKWLSDYNYVKIIYIENDTETRDRIQFVDEGVGLGQDRLIKSFSLGFSSKRLSISQLGNFGLGSKSLLSTGVDFYTVTSRYNGRLYSFDVFKDHVVSKIGKFTEKGKENKIHTFYNDYECYYEETKLKNGVIIEAAVKRHRKNDFTNGIESQLQYIENIRFIIRDANYQEKGDGTERNIKSTILFENEDIIVGENKYYAKPQLLLKPGPASKNKISYGKIDFEEMELSERSGNVAFIMDINDVDVTPSRENVIWNARTREAIKKMFLKSQGVIENIIEEKLENVRCLFEHSSLFGALRSNMGSFGALSELVKIIDISSLSLKYKSFNMTEALLETKDKQPINFLVNKYSGYGSNKIFDKLDYKNGRISISYMANVWSHLKNKSTNNTVIYVGDTRHTKMGPYLVEKFTLNTDNKLNIIFIEEDYYKKISKNKSSLSAMYADKNKKYIDIIFKEIAYLVEKHELPIIFEAQIDKIAMKTASDNQETIVKSAGLTKGQRAKIDNKVRVVIHSNISYGSYYYRKEEDFMDAQQVIVYRTTDDTVTAKLRSEYKNIPKGIKLIGVGIDGYGRFLKMPNAVSFDEACFTIKFGDFARTPFGKLLFYDDIEAKHFFGFKEQKFNSQIDKKKHKEFIKEKYKRIKFKQQESCGTY